MKILRLLAIGVIAAFCHAGAADPAALFEAPAGSGSAALPDSKIDGFVFGRLQQLGIKPANPCSDAVFLRRVYLDVIGTLPTAQEAKAFLDDKNPRKRSELIDRLLERDEYAEYQGMRWGDVLRVKAEFPINLWPNATQAYDRWIRTCIKQNVPYSRFAWDILTADGSNVHAPQVNFYRSAGSREPKALARAVALTFMGERAEKWPEGKLDAMAAFFSQVGFKATEEWKEEIVFFSGVDSDKTQKGEATFPDGTTAHLTPGKDPRETFAVWLLSSPNSPFARNAVNRVWYWLLGRGIIQEPDDSRPDNPPCNPELLAWLAHELVAANYDIKHIYRLILNSNTYQLSCIPQTRSAEAETNFAYYPIRRMEAETLIDALDQITGGTEEYSSMAPEPYTWVPPEKRSIDLPDGSISSAFLDLFGRPPRDTGLASERNNRATAAQRLHLLNSNHIRSKINNSENLRAIFRPGVGARETADQIYLTLLSRYPTDEELLALKNYSQKSEAKGGQALSDMVWALMNSTEFLYRH